MPNHPRSSRERKLEGFSQCEIIGEKMVTGKLDGDCRGDYLLWLYCRLFRQSTNFRVTAIFPQREHGTQELITITCAH